MGQTKLLMGLHVTRRGLTHYGAKLSASTQGAEQLFVTFTAVNFTFASPYCLCLLQSNMNLTGQTIM